MKQVLMLGMMVVLILPIHAAVDDSDGATILELHKKVTEGLIGFRKEYPDAQPKVYALLDQVNKLFTNAKLAFQKSVGAKKLLQDKASENVALKAELAQLKGDITTTKKTLEIAEGDLRRKYDAEHAMVERLSEEHKELLSKVASLEDVQKDMVKHKKNDTQTAALEAAVAKAVEGKAQS